jgi:hypothetical protein
MDSFDHKNAVENHFTAKLSGVRRNGEASFRQYHGQYQQQREQRGENFRTDASQP